MTMAILRANGDLIWFDAITQYNEKYTGSVSKHPLESGRVISDQTTIENRVFSFSAVISDADFNLDRPDIPTGPGSSGDLWGINNKQFVNNTPVTDFVVIKSGTTVSSLIPESVSQYLSVSIPTVTFPTTTKVKVMLKVRDELIYAQRNAEEVSFVEFRDGDINRVVDQCIITGLDFMEQPDGGVALYLNITLEEVRYATVKKTTIKKVASKGRKSAAAVTKPPVTDVDANTTPTDLSGSAAVNQNNKINSAD